MIRIAPSHPLRRLCPPGPGRGEGENRRLAHVDVMDGMFVSNISIGCRWSSPCGRPPTCFWIPSDDRKARAVHRRFADAGADLLSVHLEADMPPGIQAALAAMEKRGVKKGIALRPITGAEAVLPYVKDVDPHPGDDGGARLRAARSSWLTSCPRSPPSAGTSTSTTRTAAWRWTEGLTPVTAPPSGAGRGGYPGGRQRHLRRSRCGGRHPGPPGGMIPHKPRSQCRSGLGGEAAWPGRFPVPPCRGGQV